MNTGRMPDLNQDIPPVPQDAQPTPAPAVADRLTVRIQDMAFGGEGVARVGSFVLFVPFTAPGEEVDIEVTEVKKSFGRAKLLGVRTASPDRVTPVCRVFGLCGGCQYQHLAYPAQLAIKHKQISDLFRRIGKLADARIDPVVPCPRPYGYRNRIMVRSQWNKLTQSLVIGYLRHDCGLVVDVHECPIAEPAISDQIRHVRSHPPAKGGLKVVLRSPPEGWEVPDHSFFQNNFHLLPGLVDTVRARLQDSGLRHLVDAYCGVGFFGIELAGLVESFAGIEYDRPAVAAARKNAARRGIRNGQFLEGTVEELLPDVLKQFDPDRTALIMDPPRRGAPRPTLDFILSQRPAQILYVSCHPATLARDLEILCADGAYHLQRVVPLDMFPQTQHVECVADLRRGT